MFTRIPNTAMDFGPKRYLGIVAILAAAAINVAPAAPLSRYKTIRYPGCNHYGDHTTLYGINDAGQIVGTHSCSRDSGSTGAFLLSNGVFTAIDAPGATSTFAYGINNNAQIVGFYNYPVNGNPQGGTQAFLYSAGVFTLINPPPGFAIVVEPYGINDTGDIVGWSLGTGWTGFLDKGGTFSSFSVPGALPTFGYGLNNTGQIVGAYLDSSSPPKYHGFLYD